MSAAQHQITHDPVRAYRDVLEECVDLGIDIVAALPDHLRWKIVGAYWRAVYSHDNMHEPITEMTGLATFCELLQDALDHFPAPASQKSLYDMNVFLLGSIAAETREAIQLHLEKAHRREPIDLPRGMAIVWAWN